MQTLTELIDEQMACAILARFHQSPGNGGNPPKIGSSQWEGHVHIDDALAAIAAALASSNTDTATGGVGADEDAEVAAAKRLAEEVFEHELAATSSAVTLALVATRVGRAQAIAQPQLTEAGRLREAVEEIAREQSATSATAAADRFQSIAREAIEWKPDGSHRATLSPEAAQDEGVRT